MRIVIMNSDKAYGILSLLWDDVLIANWFNKQHIEEFLHKKLTEEQYRDIVALYNDGSMCDVISGAIRDWLAEVRYQINDILKE